MQVLTNEADSTATLQRNTTHIDLATVSELDGLGGFLVCLVLSRRCRCVRGGIVETAKVVTPLECEHRIYTFLQR